MKNMSPDELRALGEVAEKLEDYTHMLLSRDSLIREAHAAGMSKTEIADRMKLSRNTVLAVLGDDGTEEGQP